MSKKISIIIAVLNEENYIGKCLDSLLSQSYSGEFDIIIADGGSNDKTVSIINNLKLHHSNIILLHNPKICQASGRNLAIEYSDSELVAYIDAHSYADKNWLSTLFDSYSKLKKEKERTVGVGSIYRSSNTTKFIKASETAFTSILSGAGPDHYLRKTELSKVCNAYACLYERDVLLNIGLYNEKLDSGEDIELNERLSNSGYDLYVDPKAITYYARPDTSWRLFKQQFRYGHWRMISMLNSGSISIKALLPGLFFLLNLCLYVMTMFFPLASVTQVIVVGIYLLVFFVMSVNIAIKRKCSAPLLLWSSILIHLSYGIGSIYGLFHIIFGKTR